VRSRIAFALLLLLAGSVTAHAACDAKFDIQTNTTMVISTCPDSPTIAVGDTITVKGMTGSVEVTAERVIIDDTGTLNPIVHTTTGEGVIEAIGASEEVTFTANGKSGTAQVVSRLNPNNRTKWNWSVGPATKGDETGSDDDDGDDAVSTLEDAPAADDANDANSEPGAIRLQYNGDYARGGFFGRSNTNLLQTTASLNIDTTDQESADFIDNNRVAAGFNVTGLKLGRLWMHGTAGVEARVEKGFHHSNRNADIVAKVSGWIPVARSVTLFPRNGVFIAAPLSVTASYGYRDKKTDDVGSSGGVFEATALYHLFLFDKYQVDLSGQWTHTDADDLPAGTPKTQRMYKATISYLTDFDNGFKVLTSIQNGSFGVMLKEVRQYFVGVGISNLGLSGNSP
jgi:hypothetical protein